MNITLSNKVIHTDKKLVSLDEYFSVFAFVKNPGAYPGVLLDFCSFSIGFHRHRYKLFLNVDFLMVPHYPCLHYDHIYDEQNLWHHVGFTFDKDYKLLRFLLPIYFK